MYNFDSLRTKECSALWWEYLTTSSNTATCIHKYLPTHVQTYLYQLQGFQICAYAEYTHREYDQHDQPELAPNLAYGGAMFHVYF